MKRAVGLLGWLGVVLVLAAVALRFIEPELQLWSRRLALAGLVVVGLDTLSQWRDIARSFQGRNVKYGSMAAGSVVLFLGILVGLNWIANRQSARWDLTEGGQFSLADQTRQLLASLEQPVAIRAYYNANDSSQGLRDRLEPYGHESSQVQLEFIDPNRDPTTAKRDEVQQYGTVVFEYAGRIERSTASDEQSLTNALKKLLEGQTKKVYFTQGHGEKDPTNSDVTGYSGIADGLRSDNFEVETVTLVQEGRIPDDATLLVIAGPATDFLAPELQMVRDFLDRQGKVLLQIDPPDSATAPQPTGLIALARDWGIAVGDDVVVDASGLGQLIGTNESSPVGLPAPHPITERFGLITAFPFTRSVAPIEGGVDGRTAQRVMETSPQSWGETDLTRLFANGETERNLDGGDLAGPVPIAAAVAVTAPAPAPTPEAPADTPDAPRAETRLVVVGDSDFASNRALGIPGNRDLYLNMANWLAQQEDLIAIRPKDPSSRGITLTADQHTRINWLALLGIPIALIGNAVRVWWKRR
ncbi:MAG TPA: GldG family protein [Vicinamibacterales bacterium]|nr:GldG family protein [Vicinamibacterales bacterium]